MKKNIIIMVMISISLYTFSQTQKGTFSLGCETNYSSYSNFIAGGVYERNYEIKPTISYFLKDNLDLGLKLCYSSNKSIYSLNSRTDLSYGLFTKYYSNIFENKFGTFIVFDANYLVRDSLSDTYRESVMFSNIDIGLFYTPMKRFSIEIILNVFKIQYTKQFINQLYTSNWTHIDLLYSPLLSVGLKYNILYKSGMDLKTTETNSNISNQKTKKQKRKEKWE
jgi:hypothetical protein